jgi:transcriptional regulator with PAS, ATPase and Fis domain
VSPALQARLLRVLQEKVYEPLGDTRSRKADVRVVAATNKDLQELIRKTQFRSDLFYRLSVVEIELPDLRSRIEDVPLLANHFLQQLRRYQGKEILGISDDVLATLLRYDFPGNIRELKNIIEYAFILCPGGLILPEHLPERLIQARRDPGRPAAAGAAAKGVTLSEAEAQLILEALQRNAFQRASTAKELGISKTTLWRKIKQYGIPVPGRERG